MISLKNFVFNELGVNCFVLFDHTGSCIIVDPGCNTTEQQNQLTEWIHAQKLNPVYLVNTHGHFDHIFGNAFIKSVYNCPLLMHQEDLHLIRHVDKYAGMFGFIVERSPEPDGYLKDGDLLTFGESELRIIHVPGHSPGSICLYAAHEHLLIAGDVLFLGSVGRTDLPLGNHNQLISGIKEKLMVLPRDTVVWPGHGPETSIGKEYDTNPFLK